jgi:hypothetical protein
MRPIEIDFDIHKLIEAERRGFDEAPNAALRRLLKLPEVQSAPATVMAGEPNVRRTGQLPWQGEGVVLPHQTRVRMTYGRPKKTYTGAIINGEWVVEGQVFDSPSGAASGVAITGKGQKTRLNGWDLWYVQRPGETGWTLVDTLRKEAAPGIKREAEKMLKELGL